MIGRYLSGCVLAACGLMMTGCAMETADDLPPPHLGAPAMSHWNVAPPAMPAPKPKYAAGAPARPQPQPSQTAVAAGVPQAWIPKVPLNHWNWIIIHHSDSTFGSAALIDQWHRARGFDELGYHWVIGNGTNSGDGQIEVGPRWTQQKWGAHDNALDNRYNKQGIGICLVGNFDQQNPTAAQKQSLIRLVAYLMKTYHIPEDRVLGHGDTKTTDCPGKNLHVAEIRAAAERIVAEGNAAPNGAALAKKD